MDCDEINSDDSQSSSEMTSKRYKGTDWSKTFSCPYTRERHFSNFHEIEESDMDSDDEKSAASSDDEKSAASSDDEKSAVSSDNDEEESLSDVTDDEEDGSDEYCPFNDFIELSYQHHSEKREELKNRILEEGNYLNEENDLTEEGAQEEADSILKPKIQKTLKSIFTNYIIGMTEKRNTPLMKAILKKAKEYVKDGFSDTAAIKAAVSYRKHMIYDLLD